MPENDRDKSNEIEQDLQGRHKLAIRFAIDGDLRFCSHRDVMRMFGRALIRARIPIRHTLGFNPRARLSLPLPRPVGVASDDELLLVEPAEPMSPADVLERLQPQVPAGLTLLGADWLLDKHSPKPCAVHYSLPVGTATRPELIEKARSFLSAKSVVISRSEPGRPSRSVDLRPYVRSVEVEPDFTRIVANCLAGATIRPAEILDALHLPRLDWNHFIRRVRIEWQ